MITSCIQGEPEARQDCVESLDGNDYIRPVRKVLDVVKIAFELQPRGMNGRYIALMRPTDDARLDDVPIDVQGHFTLMPVRKPVLRSCQR
jgi:hypothetical protein